jgi:predicted secreted protein
MARAGYTCLVSKGGLPTTTTSEAFTSLGGNAYQVTSAARRCLDPRSPWHLSHTGGTISPASIAAADFLFGEFTVPGVTGTLRYTGRYIPLTTASEVVRGAMSFSLSESSDLNDVTEFVETQSRYRRRLYGLADAQLTVDGFWDAREHTSVASLYSSGEAFVFEVNSGYSALFRAWAKVSEYSRNTSVEGVVERSMTFDLDAQRDSNTGFQIAISDRLL